MAAGTHWWDLQLSRSSDWIYHWFHSAQNPSVQLQLYTRLERVEVRGRKLVIRMLPPPPTGAFVFHAGAWLIIEMPLLTDSDANLIVTGSYYHDEQYKEAAPPPIHYKCGGDDAREIARCDISIEQSWILQSKSWILHWNWWVFHSQWWFAQGCWH